ncbi:cytochrome P450 CYP44-like 1, partial [Homarus americanus]
MRQMWQCILHHRWKVVMGLRSLNKPHQNVRYQSSTVKSSISERHLQAAKPFSSIPGPIDYQSSVHCCHINLKSLTYHEEVCKLYHKYGPLVRENFGSRTVIHVFDPADIRAIYESDGRTPYVTPLQDTTLSYRQHKNMSLGLGYLNGEEWYQLRRAVQPAMLRPKETSYYFALQDSVAKTAVEKLQEVNQEYSSKLHLFIGKWILESATKCCLEKSLGCFSGGDKEDLAQKMVQADIEIFKLAGERKFSLQLHQFFRTRKSNKLHKAQDFFYGESLKNIFETMDEIKSLVAEKKLKDGQFKFLAYLMSLEDISEKDTAPTLLANLYCLALNPDVQERLYQEIKTHVNPDVSLTVHVVNKLHYLKAFIKEVFRFYPIGEAVQRILQKDLVLSGYHVPAGTCVDLNAYIWLRSNHYFKDPDTLCPERWLRDSSKTAKIDPYILNPFSRRFAEQDLYVGLCRLLLKFQVAASENVPPHQEWNI